MFLKYSISTTELKNKSINLKAKSYFWWFLTMYEHSILSVSFILNLPLENLSSYQEEWVGIPLTALTLPHFGACLSDVICRGIFCVQWVQLRWEVVVRFVDIGEIVDHHCLYFLFIIYVFALNLLQFISFYFQVSDLWLIDWCLTPTLAVYKWIK